MYALFKDGVRVAECISSENVVSVWVGALMLIKNLPIEGSSNNTNLNINLKEGFEIREIKESKDVG